MGALADRHINAAPSGVQKPLSDAASFAVASRPHVFLDMWPLAFVAVDVLLIWLALGLAILLRGGPLEAHYLWLGAVASITYTGCAFSSTNLSPRSLSTRNSECVAALKCWGVAAVMCMLTVIMFKQSEHFSRLVLGMWWLLAPGLVLATRWAVRRYQPLGIGCRVGARRALLFGSGPLAELLGKELEASPVYRAGSVRLVAPEDLNIGSAAFKALLEEARTDDYDSLFLVLPPSRVALLDAVVEYTADSSTRVVWIPQLQGRSMLAPSIAVLGGYSGIALQGSPMAGLGGAIKRLQDIVLSLSALLVLALPMLVIAAAIKLSSPGPVLFKQRRYGLNGQPLMVWKFRSMRVMEDGDNVIQAIRGDSRITPIGALLRRTSLDELPQFFNVLRGQMSIVGPRPHAVAHNEHYRRLIHGYMLRHLVKPGITGWAQVNGWRGETETLDKMKKRIESDLYYINNWSSWFDIKILFLTVLRGFSDKNAY